MMHASTPKVVLMALSCAGYFGSSLAVKDLYPFSRFEMYSFGGTSAGGRIVARDGAGVAHDVDAFTSWRCDAPIDIEVSACPSRQPYSTVTYRDREAADYVASHAGEGPRSQPVEVVRRIYSLRDVSGPPLVEDCVLARCRATLR